MKVEQSPTAIAQSIFRDSLAVVRAETLVTAALVRNGNALRIHDKEYDLDRFERILVLGAGKAACGMAVAVESILGGRIADGILVTKYGHHLPTERIRVIEAGHPTPDENSIKAGESILNLAESAGENDLVLFLLSGGASSQMELPREGVSLDQIRKLTNQLLKAGADITELNTVRACLSRIKGGGVARAAAKSTVAVLVISDVLGNSLGTIGSGPCFPVKPDTDAARRILHLYGIPSDVLPPVSSAEVIATPPHYIIGDVWSALNAAAESARRHGFETTILTGSLHGEAKEAGTLFGSIARDMPMTGLNCVLAAGETTVTVRGSGVGGRSQELAAYAALEIMGVESVAILAAGTDGTDGPTDAAGGLVDGETIGRARKAGIDVEDYLADNNSAPLLQAAGAQIVTGATQTNVNDLVIAIHHPITQSLIHLNR